MELLWNRYEFYKNVGYSAFVFTKASLLEEELKEKGMTAKKIKFRIPKRELNKRFPNEIALLYFSLELNNEST